MTRALVLGGGGPVGVAWEFGVLAGLEEGGLDLASADRILGTSAGALVGAQIAAGRPAGDLYAEHLAFGRGGAVEADPRHLPLPDLSPLMQFFIRRPLDKLPPAGMLIEMGTYALSAQTIGEDAFVGWVARLILTGSTWPSRFACTAVDAESGTFRLWDRTAGVGLAQAVASSCAVPGLYPPVTIEGRRYIDGGVRSPINVDAVAGATAALVIAVTVRPVDFFMESSARRELATLESGGSRTGLIVPDEASLMAFGSNLMDASRFVEVAAAGLSQGQREAERLSFWAKA